MTEKPERDFTDSLLLAPVGVTLRKDRAHSLKHHGRKNTLMREVLGWIDFWACNDPEHRFVFCELSALLTACNSGKGATQYSIQHLKRVMAELRERHIVSPYFKGPDGRWGFIVEPHGDPREHQQLRSEVVGGMCF